MRLDSVLVILRREYVSRIRTKAFWISTVALPIVFGALLVLPSLILARSSASLDLVVVDRTGQVAPVLEQQLGSGGGKGRRMATFHLQVEAPAPDAAAQRAELDRRVLAGGINAWLWIDKAGLDAGQVEYHASSVSNLVTQGVLERHLSSAVRQVRLHAAGLDDERIDALVRPVELSTIRISKEGSRAETGLAGFGLAYFLFFTLYMMLIIYGQQVMTGVLEEKSSRIVEVVLATVEPFELMMGKLAGIGLVGLTQLVIWLLTALALTAPAVLSAVAFLPEGFTMPSLPLSLVLHCVGLFLLGFFLFASFYGAIGAAFNNLQEAQQFASLGMMFLILPFLFLFVVINDPDSTLAVVLSLIPPFTPLLMMLRLAVKTPPAWQIVLGYLLTGGFLAFMVWTCARIYRIGILMYGKKPTLKELMRWARHA
jgi:ABC-2 type transport system permease protein